MNRGTRAHVAIAVCLVAAGAGTAVAGEVIEAIASPVSVRLRGLSAVSDHVAWASGREGTVLRSVDRGRTWSVVRVPGAEALDLRDIHAFSASEAVVMAAGPGAASRVFRTADGGLHWTPVLDNPDADGFFDCMDFDAAGEGRLLGDPIGGRFALFQSADRGRTWERMTGPRAVAGEAAFAASGTCVLRAGSGTLVVTGGAVARVHYLPDARAAVADWHAISVPSPSAGASIGLFSLARRDALLIAVGGDYSNPAAPAIQVALDAGPVGGCIRPGRPEGALALPIDSASPASPSAWCAHAFSASPLLHGSPGGYRSGIACARTRDPVCIATGPEGNDVLPREGAAGARWWEAPPAPHASCCDIPASAFERAGPWRPLPGRGYDSVASAGRVFWFSGDGGRLGRLVLPPSN